jgi:hypothetical protein
VSTPAPAATRPLAVGRVARAGRLRAYGPWIAAALLLIALPHVIRTPVAVPIMNQMGIAIVFALSYNMLLGQGGMLSFGHAVSTWPAAAASTCRCPSSRWWAGSAACCAPPSSAPSPPPAPAPSSP